MVPTEDQKKRYRVIEGNRRIAALKALETPALAAAAFDVRGQKRLNRLAERFAAAPIASVKCVLFASEDDIDLWVKLRHTGANEGVGLVEWGSDEKDRYSARHGQRSPEGQIIDFVEKFGALSDAAKRSNTGIITSVRRLISNPTVRERLGIEIINGQVHALYPTEEVAKSLSRMVNDLKTRRVKVGDIYNVEDRIEYARHLAPTDLPDPATRLSAPLPLGEATSTSPADRGSQPKRKQRPRPTSAERTALIPKTCRLNINPPRINQIYNELLTLNVYDYPNAGAVMLRVFLELSVDDYLGKHNVMPEPQRRTSPLAKRLKAAAADLQGKGQIDTQLEDAIKRIADHQHVLAASTVTFNQFVHNPYVFPKPSELKTAWDEVQPFMEKLWP